MDILPLESLASAYPRSHIVGCSTAGEIVDTRLADESLAVAVAQFERNTRIRTAAAEIQSFDDSLAAGKALARGLVGPELP